MIKKKYLFNQLYHDSSKINKLMMVTVVIYSLYWNLANNFFVVKRLSARAIIETRLISPIAAFAVATNNPIVFN